MGSIDLRRRGAQVLRLSLDALPSRAALDPRQLELGPGTPPVEPDDDADDDVEDGDLGDEELDDEPDTSW